MSHLAQHAKNLHENSRCGLLLNEPGQGDIQQLARLSCVADCEAITEEESDNIHRYFRYYPQALPYYEQLNFRFFRLYPKRLHLNAGFGAARWLLLYLFYGSWAAIGLGSLPLGTVALTHTGAAFLMLTFLAAHLHLTITMSDPIGANVKAMITGYEDIEEKTTEQA